MNNHCNQKSIPLTGTRRGDWLVARIYRRWLCQTHPLSITDWWTSFQFQLLLCSNPTTFQYPIRTERAPTKERLTTTVSVVVGSSIVLWIIVWQKRASGRCFRACLSSAINISLSSPLIAIDWVGIASELRSAHSPNYKTAPQQLHQQHFTALIELNFAGHVHLPNIAVWNG